MGTGAGTRFLYRIVRTEPPTLEDFLSNAARGRPLPDDPGDVRIWDGLSVYSTEAQARRKRRTSPILGQFIATLEVPADGSIRFERTRGAGHFTIWADAAVLLGLVLRVVAA